MENHDCRKMKEITIYKNAINTQELATENSCKTSCILKNKIDDHFHIYI